MIHGCFGSYITCILLNFISSIVAIVFFTENMNAKSVFITVKGFPRIRNQPMDFSEDFVTSNSMMFNSPKGK